MSAKPSLFKRTLHSLLALDTRAPLEIQPVPLRCHGLPAAFRGARIAVVSDLHLPDALIDTRNLVRCVALQKPDAIFLLGDLTNCYADFAKEDLRRTARALAAVAPCFAVPGNHEWRLEREPLYREILTSCGVTYLCDSAALWDKDGQHIQLYGMGRRRPAPLHTDAPFTVALAHKPQYFPYYRQARWPLVICGHAHGGQVRVGDRSLYAPGQGFLPAYTAGIYTADGTTMVVSRGLGNSSLPWRVGNRPHLPVLILLPDE